MTAEPPLILETATAPQPRVGAVRGLVDFYWSTMRIAVMTQLQYRAANLLSLLGWITEPVVYLVVWTTVAEARGGSIAGLTRGNIAAYYIVWTLVRNMNVTFSPYGWEHRIARGQLSAWLLRPVHPVHFDLAYFSGFKLIQLMFWLPIAVGLTVAFQPSLDPSILQVAVFSVAIWLAFIVRTLFLWALGMITFWTTRMSAIFEMYIALELFLSGRLVPMQLMPDWVQTVADFLPFSSTFFFPTRALAGPISDGELLTGLLRQLVFCAIGAGIVALGWKRAVRRYTAVGN